MRNFLTVSFLSILIVAFIRCTSSGQSKNKTQDKAMEKGLKDYYQNYFSMGVAVSPRALKTDEASLILEQFSSMTPENAMKIGPIHPKENEYNWEGAYSIAGFANRNNLKLRAHTLCWHNQTPNRFLKDAQGQSATKEVLLQRLKDH